MKTTQVKWECEKYIFYDIKNIFKQNKNINVLRKIFNLNSVLLQILIN